ISVLRRVASLNAQDFVPAIGDRNEVWIDEFAEVRNQLGQRILEILILTAPETMAFHHHTTTENIVALKQIGDLVAFSRGKNIFNNRVPFRVELLRKLFPANRRNSLLDTSGRGYSCAHITTIAEPRLANLPIL